MIDKQNLRALATAATPGPWAVTGDNDDCVTARHPEGSSWPVADADDPEDAAFIAAASPSTVLALLDEIDALYADYTSLLAERDAAQSIATQATRERAAISIQLQSVQADMGTIAGALDADNDDVGTLVGLIQSRLADRSEALAALRSIARYISCEPEDHEDLVEAMRLLVQERDAAIARAEAIEPRVVEAIVELALAKSHCKDQHGAEYRNGDLINFAVALCAGEWRKS